MSKHTPGPWTENIDRRPKGQSIEITNSNPTASALAYVPHHGKFSEANAKLIAAAPDMAEALRQAVEVFNAKEIDALQAFVMIERMRAALAKAGL